MAYPIAYNIADYIKTRLAIIRIANGYNSEIGANVLLAVREISPESLPCVCIWPGDESNRALDYNDVMITCPYRIEAKVVCPSGTNETLTSNMMLADVKEALLGPQWTHTYTLGSHEPTAGETLTGRTSAATATIQSWTLSAGTWAGGDAAGNIVLRRKSGVFGSESCNVGATASGLTIATGFTAQSHIKLSTNDLAKKMDYVSGGLEEYPDMESTVLGVQATFNIIFSHHAYDPYRLA